MASWKHLFFGMMASLFIVKKLRVNLISGQVPIILLQPFKN